MTTVSVLELMPNTAREVESFSADLKQRILSGELDFRRFLEMRSFIDKTLEAVHKDKDVKDLMETEIHKYGKSGLVYNGLRFTVAGKTTYNYKHDPVWLELEEKKKQRESFLKSLKNSVSVVDPDSGEVNEYHPATWTKSDYIKTEVVK